MNWYNIEYLLSGNHKQKTAYKILKEIDIFNILKSYNPILVGTIPINIDLDTSDLDIICQVNHFEAFNQNRLFERGVDRRSY